MTRYNKPLIMFGKRYRRFFDSKQNTHFDNIEKYYSQLERSCVSHVDLPQTGTHKEWINSRVKFHVNSSIMRLLYLAEGFCDVTKKFNSTAAAACIKAMVEIPLHIGYITWILDNNNSFKKIQSEFKKNHFWR